MFRKFVSSLLLCVVLASLAGAASHARPRTTRAVSLNALANALKSGRGTKEARSLCGITRLCGYIPDPETKDIILLGVVEPEAPPLHLEDFVVALRSAWGEYARTVGNVRYYTDPGCSIDPNPAVFQQLKDFDQSHPDLTTPEAMRARAEAWKAIGSQPQKVRVLGVPFDCRFAKVMVDADYYMKRIANGTVKLDIDGLKSISDLDLDAQRQALISGNTSMLAGGSMSRFWFSPAETTYEVRDGATILRSCQVELLTEAEYLNEHGAITRAGKADPYGAQFARSFSKMYDEIAAQRPIYRELKALFSFVAIARLMKDDHVERTAGASLRYFLRSYKVPCVPISRAVKGLAHVKLTTETIETPSGPRQYHLIQSSCGGVSMSVRPKRVTSAVPHSTKASPAAARPAAASASPSRSPQASSRTSAPKPAAAASSAKNIRREVLGARKSPTAMSWDVPVELD